MRRITAIITILLAFGLYAQAAPGDTTKVQTFNGKYLNHYGSFDTMVAFPAGTVSYRKIMMTFTLGKYSCPGYNPNNAGEGPGQTGWCGDWDYDVHLFVMTKTGDTLEMGRFITPYARENAVRTPTTWKQRYEFDVTDYYNQLQDSATIRIFYSGYSWGFTGDLKFDFIEGMPPRYVLGVDRLWKGGYNFGRTAPIDDAVTSFTKTSPNGMAFAEMKFNITGHGADDNGCSEFCKKYYNIKLNGVTGQQTDIWRPDCGFNHLYPQSGTWVYDRGNWCPGDVVFTNIHKLVGITPGNSYDIDVDFEPYTGSIAKPGRSWGTYNIQAAVFYYSIFNKNIDASLDDIIAPSDHETHYRSNPATGKPTVKVQNTGGTTITSIKFRYEMAGGSGQKEYTWQGSLAALASAQIEFPPFYDLRTATGSTNIFNVEIAEVNGVTDEDATNNKMSSMFKAALQLPQKIVVDLRTNASTLAGISETSWKIVDLFNNITMAERKNNAASTLYSDTITLGVGMYKLVVEDAGCDGLYWWANTAGGTGSMSLKRATSPIPLAMTGYFSGDFGCGFTQYFNVDWPASVTEINSAVPAIEAYPNPAQTTVMVTLGGIDKINGKLQVKDMTGRVIAEQVVTDAVTTVDVSALANGVYMVVYTGKGTTAEKLQARIVVAR